MADRAAAILLDDCRDTLRRVARRLRALRGRGPSFRRERQELRSVEAELRAQACDLVRLGIAGPRPTSPAHRIRPVGLATIDGLAGSGGKGP
jgi:hypothetical protein